LNYEMLRAIRNHPIERGPKAVLWALLSFSDEAGESFPSKVQLARASGIKRTAVTTAIATLQTEGLIVVDQNPGGSSTYLLTVPGGRPATVQRRPATEQRRPVTGRLPLAEATRPVTGRVAAGGRPGGGRSPADMEETKEVTKEELPPKPPGLAYADLEQLALSCKPQRGGRGPGLSLTAPEARLLQKLMTDHGAQAVSDALDQCGGMAAPLRVVAEDLTGKRGQGRSRGRGGQTANFDTPEQRGEGWNQNTTRKKKVDGWSRAIGDGA
jgi:hypothetical protein